MRRKDKEITDRHVIDSIIRHFSVCRLAMSDNDQPYVVPINFGYDGHSLYFHGAPAGRKIDILKKSNRVCFEFDVTSKVVKFKTACEWSVNYQSVIGFGKAFFIEDFNEKKAALDVIMGQYSNEHFEYTQENINKTAIIKVEIESITGKMSSLGS